MRIFQIGKYYTPSVGGIETVLLHLAEGQRQRGHQVRILCSAETSYSSHEWIRNVEVHRAGRWSTIFSQPISPTTLPTFLRHAANSDVLHFHSPNPWAEMMGTFLSPRVKKVVTYHSDIIRQKWAVPVYGPILNLFLKTVDRIVVPTQAHIDHSPFLIRHREKCVVVPFGIDPSPFAPEMRDEAQIQANRTRFGKYLLFVGRLVGYKGVDVAIRAMSQAPRDVSLVIVGEGPLRKTLEEQARVAGLAQRVHFLGSVASTEKLVQLYHAAEAFVLPSITRAEAYGMVLLEAMACGKPLLTSKLPSGVSWVNQDQETGLHFEVGSSESLARAMQTLFGNENLRKKMGLAAHERFNRFFTREAMIVGYESVYRELTRS